MNKHLIPKERIIYSNYDLTENYPDEYLKKTAIECGWVNNIDEITDEMIQNWRYEEADADWENTYSELKNFFENKTVIFFGASGRWNGVFEGGDIGDFDTLFNDAITDCNFLKFYDVNGHLYLTCSHHDGTNNYEIKEVTKRGLDFYDRWEAAWEDQRTNKEIHKSIIDHYSTLPRFSEKVYGCKSKEYEKQSKEAFIRKLNNQATSFYYPNGYNEKALKVNA